MDKSKVCVQRTPKVRRNLRIDPVLDRLATVHCEFHRKTYTALIEDLLYEKFKSKIKIKKIPTDYSKYDINNIPFDTITREVYEEKC